MPNIDPATNRFAAGQGYLYDKNGNLNNDPVGGDRQFVFNGNNRQSEVKDSNGTVIGKYFYDGEGRRIKKKTYSGGVETEETVFVYSGGKLVAEYSTAAPPSNPTTNYTVSDQLGSPRILVNALGAVISRRDFMPFGEELAPDATHRTTSLEYGSDDSVRQKFTGYQKDNETGLDFAEARMYENRHARFTAVDPLLSSGKSANPQTFNRYVYVSNNPLIYTDPTGLQAASWVGTVYRSGNTISRDALLGENNEIVEGIHLRFVDATDGYTYTYNESGSTNIGLTDSLQARWSRIGADTSLGALFRGFSQRINDAVVGIGKGIGRAPAEAVNGITGTLLNHAGGSLYFQGSNPLAVPLPFAYNNETEASYGSASSTGTLFGLGTASGTIFGGSARLSVVPETTPGSTVTVGRWMSQNEFNAMRETGTVQQGGGGTTYVAFPANPNSYIGPTSPGSVYAEFGVPRSSLQPAGRPDWAQIPGPNSLFGRNEFRFGRPVPQMPPATNPCIILCRTSVQIPGP